MRELRPYLWSKIRHNDQLRSDVLMISTRMMKNRILEVLASLVQVLVISDSDYERSECLRQFRRGNRCSDEWSTVKDEANISISLTSVNERSQVFTMSLLFSIHDMLSTYLPYKY